MNRRFLLILLLVGIPLSTAALKIYPDEQSSALDVVCRFDGTIITGNGTGGGNPFNQNLNTTNNVTFANITITKNSHFSQNISTLQALLAEKICIAGDCRTAWPSGSGNNSWNQSLADTLYASFTYANTTYVQRANWSTIDNYPAGCSSNAFVTGISDTLSCSTVLQIPNNLNMLANNITNISRACYDNACTSFDNATGRYWDSGVRYIVSNGTAVVIQG